MGIGNPGEFPNAPSPSSLDILKNSSVESLTSSAENLLQRISSELEDGEKKERLLTLGQDLASKLSAGEISNEDAATDLAGLYDELVAK